MYVPKKADLAPVGITGTGGAALTIGHPKIMRNIYYIADDLAHQFACYLADDIVHQVADSTPHGGIVEFTDGYPAGCPDLADPTTWDRFHRVQDVTFALGQDQFFMLGDNSACSLDGRFWKMPYWPGQSPSKEMVFTDNRGKQWTAHYWVDRELLIGRALLIYWPHSWDEIIIGGHNIIPFPYFPNFSRMGFVK
jgi:signal peptidase I